MLPRDLGIKECSHLDVSHDYRVLVIFCKMYRRLQAKEPFLLRWLLLIKICMLHERWKIVKNYRESLLGNDKRATELFLLRSFRRSFGAARWVIRVLLRHSQVLANFNILMILTVNKMMKNFLWICRRQTEFDLSK